MKIGDLSLDEERLEVLRDGKRLDIEPLIYRLLLRLARAPGDVVSKDDLIAEVWSGQVVGDSALTRAVSIARKLLRSDQIENPIQSVYGTGYRLVVHASASRDPAVPVRVPTDSAPEPVRRFVGRARELVALSQSVDRVRGGEGGLILISGEAGIGKTRLCEELARSAVERAVPVRVGRCVESSKAPSFWPWIQILRAERAARGREDFARIAGQSLVHLDSMLGESEDGDATPSELQSTRGRDRFTMLDAATQFFVRSAAERAQVLVLDDLHRADRSSLALLRFLASELREIPLLIIGCYRDAELQEMPFERRELAECVRIASAETLALQGLGESDIAMLLSDSNRIDSMIRSLHEKTGGNPLFLTQLLSLQQADGENATAEDVANLPPALRDAIRLQLDGLSGQTRALLAAAAPMGREFDVELLAISAEMSRDSILIHLGEATKYRVIVPVDNSRSSYRFSHVLVSDCLYDSLTAHQRARWHRRLALAMRQLHGDSVGSHVTTIAHHFRLAAVLGDTASAIEWSERAGAYALQRLAYVEAAQEFESALEFLRGAGTRDRERMCLLLLSISDAQIRAGDPEGARTRCREAVALANQLDSADLLARAAITMSPEFLVINSSQYDPELITVLESAIEANPTASPVTVSKLLGNLAGALYWTDDVERRDQLSEHALAVIAPSTDDQARANALHARRTAVWGPDNLDERIRLSREALSISERIGDRESSLLYRTGLLTDLAERGEFDALDREIDTYEALAQELRQSQSLWMAPLFRGMRALMQGRFEEGQSRAAEFAAVGNRVQALGADLCWGAYSTVVGMETGSGASVFPLMYKYAIENPRLLAFRPALAWLGSELGRTDEARGLLDDFASEGFENIPRDMNWLGTTLMLAMAATVLRDSESAPNLFARLKPYGDRYGLFGHGALFIGSVAVQLARLASILGEHELSEQYFESGHEMDRRASAHPWVARSLYYRGVENHIHGHHERASSYLDQAGDLAAELGMKHLSSMVDGAKASPPQAL